MLLIFSPSQNDAFLFMNNCKTHRKTKNNAFQVFNSYQKSKKQKEEGGTQSRTQRSCRSETRLNGK